MWTEGWMESKHVVPSCSTSRWLTTKNYTIKDNQNKPKMAKSYFLIHFGIFQAVAAKICNNVKLDIGSFSLLFEAWNPFILLICLSIKCCLLNTSAAYVQMLLRLVLSWKQTLWTLIRLLQTEVPDLGPYCLPYRPPKRKHRTIVLNNGKE